MSITVIQVFESLGVHPAKELTWSVGSRVAALYRQTYGTEPPKANRPKTGGGGSHCFAIYPDDWYRHIADMVAKAAAVNAAQMDLFV